MVMAIDGAIVSGFCPPELQLLHEPHVTKHLQISIDGPEAYFWKSFADDSVYSSRGRMRFEPPQLFQDHLSLTRIALEHLVLQHLKTRPYLPISLFNENYY
jgi:hypothetical protein